MSTALLEQPAPEASAAFGYTHPTFALDEIAAQTRALHEDGFAIIRDVLSPAEIEEMRGAVDRLATAPVPASGYEWWSCVFNRDPVFFKYLDRVGIVDLAESVLCKSCHVIASSVLRSHPGFKGWQPHTDRVFFELPEDVAMDPRVQLPIFLCTAHYYLEDLTLDLCPTWVIPGSHRSGRVLPWGKIPDPVWQGRRLEPVLVKAGDVIFFRCEIWHTGSDNTSDRVRRVLQVHYANRWVAQHFQPGLQFPFDPDLLAGANPRQRRLLGEHSPEAYG